MSHVKIRTGRYEDAHALLLLLSEAAAADGSAGDNVTLTEEVLERDAFGDDAPLSVLVAVIDGGVIGCVVWFPKYSTWVGAPGLYIEDIAVQEDLRGKGIGRILMSAVAALARDRDYKFIDLAVGAQNPARKFYEDLGILLQPQWVHYRMPQGTLDKLAALAPDIGDV